MSKRKLGKKCSKDGELADHQSLFPTKAAQCTREWPSLQLGPRTWRFLTQSRFCRLVQTFFCLGILNLFSSVLNTLSFSILTKPPRKWSLRECYTISFSNKSIDVFKLPCSKHWNSKTKPFNSSSWQCQNSGYASSQVVKSNIGSTDLQILSSLVRNSATPQSHQALCYRKCLQATGSIVKKTILSCLQTESNSWTNQVLIFRSPNKLDPPKAKSDNTTGDRKKNFLTFFFYVFQSIPLRKLMRTSRSFKATSKFCCLEPVRGIEHQGSLWKTKQTSQWISVFSKCHVDHLPVLSK